MIHKCIYSGADFAKEGRDGAAIWERASRPRPRYPRAAAKRYTSPSVPNRFQEYVILPKPIIGASTPPCDPAHGR